jgi:hypothetical protein
MNVVLNSEGTASEDPRELFVGADGTAMLWRW